MSLSARVRPSARVAAESPLRRRASHSRAVQHPCAVWPPLFGRLGLLVHIGSHRLLLASALFGLALPFTASATPLPSQHAAAHAGAGELTLYSEPGLRGRRATYKTATLDVERQGFVARSATSVGMWTLCEGGEVASRCQTVEGQAQELRLAPQIVRPGLNALGLYDQPGLRGRRLIYSFAADRPAPFHARSAQTWGGPWSLCERGFKHCQTLEGRTANLDFVVEAVKPEAGSTDDLSPSAQTIPTMAARGAGAAAKAAAAIRVSAPPRAKSRSTQSEAADQWVPTVAPRAARTTTTAAAAIPVSVTPRAKSRSTHSEPADPLVPTAAPRAARFATKRALAIEASVKSRARDKSARSEPARSRSPDRAPRPQRLVHVDAPVARVRRPDPAREARLVHARATRRPHQHPALVMVRQTHAKASRPPHRGIIIEFVDAIRGHGADDQRRWRPAHVVRTEVVSGRPPRSHLVHHVADRRGRAARSPHRSDYRRVHMMWGGPDPYLYDVDPRPWGPPEGW